MEKTDSLQARFKSFEITDPKIKSSLCGDYLERMCLSENCKQSSLFCGNKDCQKSYQKHQNCLRSVPLGTFTKKLNHHFRKNRELLIKIEQVEDEIIEQMKQGRTELIKRMELGYLEQNQEKIIYQIYRQERDPNCQGKQADELYMKLERSSKQNNLSDDAIRGHGQIAQKSVQLFKISLEKVLNSYYDFINPKKEKKQKVDQEVLTKDSDQSFNRHNFIEFQSIIQYKSLDEQSIKTRIYGWHEKINLKWS